LSETVLVPEAQLETQAEILVHPVTGQEIEVNGPFWPPHPITVSRSLLTLDLSGEPEDP